MNLTESESNNLRNEADIMNVGDTMTGKLSAVNDVDCFKVVFGQKAWVTFELDIPAGTDYRIRVYTNDNSGENYAAQDIRLNYLGQMRKCSTAVSSTSDIYYICISVNTSGNYNASANYTLRVLYSNNAVQTYITNSINTLGITNGYDTSNPNNKYWNKGSLSASDWGLTSSTIGTPNTFGNAYECAGFSFYLAYLIFNQSISMVNGEVSIPTGWNKVTNNYSNICLKPGDIVRKNGHSATVWKLATNSNGETTIYVIECLGSVYNLVRYGGYNGTTLPGKMSDLLSGSLEYILISPIK